MIRMINETRQQRQAAIPNRYRNLNQQQQAKVDRMQATGNYGPGKLGQIAGRRDANQARQNWQPPQQPPMQNTPQTPPPPPIQPLPRGPMPFHKPFVGQMQPQMDRGAAAEAAMGQMTAGGPRPEMGSMQPQRIGGIGFNQAPISPDIMAKQQNWMSRVQGQRPQYGFASAPVMAEQNGPQPLPQFNSGLREY